MTTAAESLRLIGAGTVREQRRKEEEESASIVGGNDAAACFSVPARPSYLHQASQRAFEKASTAGRNFEYGAVGEFDYRIVAEVWAHGNGTRDEHFARTQLLSTNDLLRVLESEHPAFRKQARCKARVLDLGCGDGKFLYALHHNMHRGEDARATCSEEEDYPWQNLLGVSAEDMRFEPMAWGTENCDEGKPGFDPHCPESSYLLANIETLQLKNQYDFIVSWTTFCWLSDPLGTLLHVYNELLAPGGVLCVSSFAIEGLVLEDRLLACDECQEWLFAWAKWLREDCGLCIELIAEGVFSYVLLVKPAAAEQRHRRLTLTPCFAYHGLDAGEERKAVYRIMRGTAASEAVAQYVADGDFAEREIASVRYRTAEADVSAAEGTKKGRQLTKQYPAEPPDWGRVLRRWVRQGGEAKGQGHSR